LFAGWFAGLRDREVRAARKTSRWDAADTLETKEDIAAYLDAVLEGGDPDLLKASLGDVARAKGVTEIAHSAGVGRTNLYKALSQVSGAFVMNAQSISS